MCNGHPRRCRCTCVTRVQSASVPEHGLCEARPPTPSVHETTNRVHLHAVAVCMYASNSGSDMHHDKTLGAWLNSLTIGVVRAAGVRTCYAQESAGRSRARRRAPPHERGRGTCPCHKAGKSTDQFTGITTRGGVGGTSISVASATSSIGVNARGHNACMQHSRMQSVGARHGSRLSPFCFSLARSVLCTNANGVHAPTACGCVRDTCTHLGRLAPRAAPQTQPSTAA